MASPLIDSLKQLRDQNIISDLDLHFAQFMTQLSPEADEGLLAGATLVSYFTAQGHSCLALDVWAEQAFPPLAEPENPTFTCPALATWLATLKRCAVVGMPGDYAPLILDGQCLYLYRYWDYEQQLAYQIYQRLQYPVKEDRQLFSAGLSRLFPDDTHQEQKIAAHLAVSRHFCIISGGPGTGKTSTVVKILALLLAQNPNLKIALAAPTGKAAARLQATVTQMKPTLPCAPATIAAMPQEAYTLHRLLGSLPHSPHFKSHANNPLPYDVVVVDEASMIDLALMTQLAQAIPLTSRWILLGDKDQLASVSTGSVLSDIEIASQTQPRLKESQAWLYKSYRFNQYPGIEQLAQAVKAGQGERALQLLKSPDYPEVNWHFFNTPDVLPSLLAEDIVAGFQRYLAEKDPEKSLQYIEKYRILCALRYGPYGVVAINRLVEHILSMKKLIHPHTTWYPGRPVLITHNDYSLGLFNGDIGVILWDQAKPRSLRAFFPTSTGGIRAFSPHRLPAHETVYAMTIHKSQGSEFEQILMLLPPHYSPILSQELIYTGITRSRHQIKILGQEYVFKTVVSHKISRTSGLSKALQNWNY